MKTDYSLTILKWILFIGFILFLIVGKNTADNLTALFSSMFIYQGIQYKKVYSPLTESRWMTRNTLQPARRMKRTDMLPDDLIGLIHDEEIDRLERKLKKNPHMKVSRIF